MTTNQIMQRILLWGGILAAAVAVVGGIVGWLLAAGAGVASALVGTALAIVFCMLTAASILLAFKVSKGAMISGAFFGIVLGGWLVKFVLFIVLVFVLGDQDWLHRGVAFGALVAAVIGSLVIDCVVIMTSRQPTIDSDADDETQGRPARGAQA
ncbi:hypothetical protein [Agrococcus sp. BE272]|uniref:hypothetical protein n=1 Tax=Agrococcus sp. BE272 TaxID=2817727 RepID=UPI00285C2A50|nr:hypothetical protein [Agrococcus sp. BE272]MDR7232973.1 putative MnhB-related membrane protein [Agrococcus sp. BE272]